MNTTINGVGAYASSDLARPHPTKPDYYCIWGRVDDQIMHNTGEKVRYAWCLYGMISAHSSEIDESQPSWYNVLPLVPRLMLTYTFREHFEPGPSRTNRPYVRPWALQCRGAHQSGASL